MRIVALLIAAGAACAQSSSPEQLFRDAVAAQQHGDDALAVRKYQELLKRYPDAVEVRANLGAALAKLERYDEAIEQYRAVLAKKDNAGLRLNLALAYYKKGALREAVQQLSTLQGAQPGLRHGIWCQAGLSDQAGGGSCIDDVPGPLPQHRGVRGGGPVDHSPQVDVDTLAGSGPVDHSPQVDVDTLAPMIEREIAHFARHTDARVVEHVIQAAVREHGVFHQALDIRSARYIEWRGRGPAAICVDRGGHCLRAFAVDIGDHGHRSTPGQFLAERAADAGSPAGHDGNPVVE